MSAIMFQPSEFLCPAEKLPLLFRVSYVHLAKSVSYTNKFLKIVKESQGLLNAIASFLWQVHTTQENMLSLFNAMCVAVDSNNTVLLKALPGEIQQWVCELLEELSDLRKRWREFDATLNAIWRTTVESKDEVVGADNPRMDFFMEMNPDLKMHLIAAAKSLSEAVSVPQDILCFLRNINDQLQARKQEWRKIQLLLNCQDPGIQQSIKQANENWQPLSTQCLTVKRAFDDRRINEIYKLVLHRDPADMTMEEWKVEEEDTFAQISQLNTEASQ